MVYVLTLLSSGGGGGWNRSHGHGLIGTPQPQGLEEPPTLAVEPNFMTGQVW
jgi:hypothetical protein